MGWVALNLFKFALAIFVRTPTNPLIAIFTDFPNLESSCSKNSLNDSDGVHNKMSSNSEPNNMSKLENFDDLFVGNPIDIEKNLRELLPQAFALEDKSTYLQILSQVALTQAMQKNFKGAHETLNSAERLLTSENELARVRILLERGRTFMQEGNIEAARPLFVQSYELSSSNHFDFHTANAAHMIAIVAVTPEDKIKWNLLAIELVVNSKSIRAQAWRGSLYNNLGQAYIEEKEYSKALEALKKAQVLREEEGYAPNIRVAKWAVARALRFLNQNEEALNILLPLIKEYNLMVKQDNLDLPLEMLPSLRGLVYEELAEIYAAKAKGFAKLAHEDLSKDEWFKKTEPSRLERLKHL